MMNMNMHSKGSLTLNDSESEHNFFCIRQIIWRSCIQSVITAFSVKTKRTSHVYVSSALISLVMVSPFALVSIMFKKLIIFSLSPLGLLL